MSKKKFLDEAKWNGGGPSYGRFVAAVVPDYG
jgi:hypothetical protein